MRHVPIVVLLGLVACTAAGCRRPTVAPPSVTYDEAAFARKAFASFTVALDAKGDPTETIVGAARSYVVRDGDTLLDVARLHDLGFNEIVEANPGVDPWVPRVGTTIALPTTWVLPCCTYRGLVVNIPEMRLFWYEQSPGDGRHLRVQTFPVGLGRKDRRTPRGTFTVRGKTVNPAWVVPETIRAEHVRERGDARRVIRGGAEDNPLGKFRLELSLAPYAIHGSDIPWGVGMQVSHGCVRLYPEDIERLFTMVPIGAPGEFVYQPVKVGRRSGRVWVEVHPDVYGFTGKTPEKALDGALWRARVRPRPSAARLATALRESRGLPVAVTGP